MPTYIGGRRIARESDAAGAANEINVDGTNSDFKINNVAVTSTAAELNALDGITSTVAELNILDGVTSTTAELNILDGVTSTTAELNILDGVTSTATELNLVDGLTTAPVQTGVVDAIGDLIVATAADTVARLAVGANGRVLTANSGDTAGVGYEFAHSGGLPAAYRASSTLVAATGDPQLVGSGTHAISDGVLYFRAVYLPYDVTLTGVVFVMATAGAYTANNENRVGLYTSDGTELTLVASSADVPTLWQATANVVTQQAFSATYAAQSGRYWIGVIYNNSAQTTAPLLRGHAAPGHQVVFDILMTDADELMNAGVVSATLATPQAWSGTSAQLVSPWLGLY